VPRFSSSAIVSAENAYFSCWIFRQPLMVEPRRVDRFLRVHAKSTTSRIVSRPLLMIRAAAGTAGSP